jgi:hypothetical protein
MVEHAVTQLLRDLERTIHERVEAIELFLRTKGQSSEQNVSVGSDKYDSMMRAHQYLLGRIDALEQEVEQLRMEKAQDEIPFDTSSLFNTAPLSGIVVSPKIDPPESINEADRLLLNSSARKALDSKKVEAPVAVAAAPVAAAPVPVAVAAPVAAAPVPEPDEEVQEDDDAPQEEEDEQGLELDEFEYKGSTYYRDQDKNVYMADENGDIDTENPIGVWSEVKGRIITRKPNA